MELAILLLGAMLGSIVAIPIGMWIGQRAQRGLLKALREQIEAANEHIKWQRSVINNRNAWIDTLNSHIEMHVAAAQSRVDPPTLH